MYLSKSLDTEGDGSEVSMEQGNLLGDLFVEAYNSDTGVDCESLESRFVASAFVESILPLSIVLKVEGLCAGCTEESR